MEDVGIDSWWMKLTFKRKDMWVIGHKHSSPLKMGLYGNREDILTEYYGNTKRKDTVKTWWEGRHVVWFSQSHELCPADTFVLWSPYFLTKHTNHNCIALSHPIPFLFFPLKATPSYLWHSNLNVLSPEQSLFSNCHLDKRYFCRVAHLAPRWIWRALTNLSLPLCVTVKNAFNAFNPHL